MNKTYKSDNGKTIQLRALEEPLWDFLCNINYILIEFLEDCRFSLDDECPLTFKKGDSCVLGFHGDHYIEKEDVIMMSDLELYSFEVDGLKCLQLNCAKEIYNETKALVNDSFNSSRRKQMKRFNFPIRGTVIGKPQYGATSNNILFPIKLDHEIRAKLRNIEKVIVSGETLLIESRYACYIKKGDKIQIKEGKLFNMTGKMSGKTSFLIITKNFIDTTLKFPVMPC